MEPNLQDWGGSPQFPDTGQAEPNQQLRDMDTENNRLRDEKERAETILKVTPDQEDGQLAKAQFLTLESEDTAADAQISQLRKSVDRLSRSSPWTRPLHILDLPDEILITIFEVVHDWRPWHDDHSRLWDPLDQLGTQYIQNVRLTCRRFCSTSSHLLINSIPVEVCQSSLANLREISSHSTISKGVKAIQVYLALYDNTMAGDLVQFVEYHNNRLLGNVSMLQGPLRDLLNCSKEDALRHTERIRRMTQAWTALAQRTADYSPTEEDLGFQKLLRRGFEKYQIRYAEQQELLDGGILIAEIASAMAAMPAAKGLEIRDEADLPVHFRRDRRIPFKAQLLDDEKLCESLFGDQPMSYELQHHHHLGPDAIPIIPNLLAALDAANLRITSLSISLSTLGDFSRLDPHDLAPDMHLKIRSAMQDLRAFDFRNHGRALVRSHHEMEVLRDFLALVANVEYLESLSVKLNLWDDESALDPATMTFVSVIKSETAWAYMSTIILDTVLIEYSALEHLLRCVRSPQGFVGLHKVHLTDGSWIAVLDLLRERHGWANLTSPSGAECEAMSLEEYERVFGPYDGIGNRTQEEEAYPDVTEAEAYIRGWGADNPLVLRAELDPDYHVASGPE